MTKVTELNSRVARPPNPRTNGPSRNEYFDLLARHIIEVADAISAGGAFDYQQFFTDANMTHAAEAELKASIDDA